MAVIVRNQPFSKFFLHFGVKDHLRVNIFLVSNCSVTYVAKLS